MLTFSQSESTRLLSSPKVYSHCASEMAPRQTLIFERRPPHIQIRKKQLNPEQHKSSRTKEGKNQLRARRDTTHPALAPKVGSPLNPSTVTRVYDTQERAGGCPAPSPADPRTRA